MGTSAGPSLAGIGRGGDSNLVLEMDAHDAKSYPGEPTYNVMANPLPLSGWTVSNSGGSTATVSFNSEDGVPHMEISDVAISTSDYPRINMAALLNTITDNFSISFEAKCNIDGTNLSIALYSGGITKTTQAATLTPEWERYTFENITTGFTLDGGYLRPNETVTGAIRYIRRIQIEQKTYSTPFVGAQHNNPMLRGASSRPASVNLMIHGDVGTGQTFSDSSPSKHTITTVGNTTHSTAQSKFSGGSIYFDGTGDSLTATSTDFAVGSGEFTIDAWLYKTASTDYETLFDTYSAAGSNGFLCGLWTNSTISFYSENGIGWVAASGSTQVALNTWTHLAWVRSGNNLRMFVDGVQQTNVTFGADNLDSSSLIIGGRSTAQYITGYMDEMRITKGTALWTSNFTPPTRRNLSAPVVDRSGNHNGGDFATTDPTDVATYRVGEVIRPIANAYWNFDGTDDSISLGGTTAAASDRPLNAYPFTFTAWVTSDNGWVSPSGMNELLNMNIAGQRVSLGSTVYSGWPTGPAIMYGGTSHWTCPSSAFGNPTGWTHVAFVIYGSNNSNHKIYINGVSQALTDNGLAHGGTAGWTLGSNSVSAEHWVGNIANAQLYDKTLTEAEVIENFNQQRSRFKI